MRVLIKLIFSSSHVGPSFLRFPAQYLKEAHLELKKTSRDFSEKPYTYNFLTDVSLRGNNIYHKPFGNILSLKDDLQFSLEWHGC